MIDVTRLNGEAIVVNAGLIESLEATPDTLVCLVTGKKFMVREPVSEVVARIIAYQQRIGHVSILPTALAEMLGEGADEE